MDHCQPAGSVLFLVGACGGLAVCLGWLATTDFLETWVINQPYLIGSVAFFLSGWVQMRMWKAQQAP